jgi:hypothetical protein
LNKLAILAVGCCKKLITIIGKWALNNSKIAQKKIKKKNYGKLRIKEYRKLKIKN